MAEKIEKIKSIMMELCKNKEWGWKNHIESVVKHSLELAKKLKADMEVCELAAWLHDISRIKDIKTPLHHVKGAEEAEEILRKFGYPESTIEKVKHCIATHSSDGAYPPESKEAKIIACADAMAHFDNFPDLAYTAYKLRGLSVDEGREWIRKKYERCWTKLMPEAREIIRPKYDAIKIVLKE